MIIKILSTGINIYIVVWISKYKNKQRYLAYKFHIRDSLKSRVIK